MIADPEVQVLHHAKSQLFLAGRGDIPALNEKWFKEVLKSCDETLMQKDDGRKEGVLAY